MNMPNRTAKFVSALFASLLAGTPLTTISHSAPGAADNCLSGPKGTAPDGGHWYYRIDRATKRACWYVRSEDKSSQAAASDSSPSAKPVAPKADAATQRSIADARAELPMPQMRAAPEISVASAQRAPANAADTAATENKPSPNADIANSQTSLVAARWPWQTQVSSPTLSESATAPVASVAPTPNAAPPPVAAITLAAAEAPSKSPFGSIQMLLTVVMGALSIAAVMGGAIFKFGGSRAETRGRRRVNWGTYPDPDLRIADIPRDFRAADDPNRRISEMLARLPRRAAG
jgi:hypothetical protein